MLEIATGLASLRTYHDDADTRDLLRVVLNAVSAAEATIALRMLEDEVPEKVLVSACNLREVFAALPSTPCPIAVDAVVLERAGGFTRKPLGVLSTWLDDGVELDVLVAGNLMLDIVLRTDDGTAYLSPVPVTCEYVTPRALDTLLSSDAVLPALLEIVRLMGHIFNPPFYLSLEDFRLEHARAAMEGIGDLF